MIHILNTNKYLDNGTEITKEKYETNIIFLKQCNIYANNIINGKNTLETIPSKFRTKVKEIIDSLSIPSLEINQITDEEAFNIIYKGVE